jgi:hypothetical protein
MMESYGIEQLVCVSFHGALEHDEIQWAGNNSCFGFPLEHLRGYNVSLISFGLGTQMNI